ncbi:MAG: hypothetical protein PVSMB6_20110 [Steroidobacteraceae bacterium]
MKTWIACLFGLLCLSAGCASHEVRCDGRLQPINAVRAPAGHDAHAPGMRSRDDE